MDGLHATGTNAAVRICHSLAVVPALLICDRAFLTGHPCPAKKARLLPSPAARLFRPQTPLLGGGDSAETQVLNDFRLQFTHLEVLNQSKRP